MLSCSSPPKYKPAACIGRKANGPIGHQCSLGGLSDFCKQQISDKYGKRKPFKAMKINIPLNSTPE
jgi:hypothetical protein